MTKNHTTQRDVTVEDDLTAHPVDAVPQVKAYPGVGPCPKPRYRTAPVPLHEHIATAGRDRAAPVSWREGSRGSMSSTFVVIRVRPAGREHTHRLSLDDTLDATWLLAQWPEDADGPVKYWLSNLGEDVPITELVRLGEIRWRIEHDYRELKEALGLDHFEGRTWAGWHRHVTLVTAAHLFATTLRSDPKAPARPEHLRPAAPAPATPGHLDRGLHHLPPARATVPPPPAMITHPTQDLTKHH